VQLAGPDAGAPRAPGRVPGRHRGERSGLRARRAGVPAVRRLRGGVRREPFPALRALRRRGGLRRAQGRAALHRVAGRRHPGPGRSGEHARPAAGHPQRRGVRV
ncbi:MAG: hypothetical protein AVDCRST_MAG52-2397, partial [uncultured Blastococcus sp.]